MMIKRFHEVIEKRGIIRAKTFLKGTSKLSLAQTTVSDTIEEENEDVGEHSIYQVGVTKTIQEKVRLSVSNTSNNYQVVCKL